MPLITSYAVDNDRRFREQLARAKEAVGDLRIPLNLVAKDFFKSQAAIWKNKGPGRYPDLSPGYKKAKKSKWGFIYPILRASGALERSMTDPKDPNAIAEIINRDTLLLGTRVSYGIYAQQGSPLRKFLFIGPEAPSFATSEQMGRLERWNNILNSHVLRVLGAPVDNPNVFVFGKGQVAG